VSLLIKQAKGGLASMASGLMPGAACHPIFTALATLLFLNTNCKLF